MAAIQVVAAPRTPDWVIDDYLKFNPPADVGCPLCNEKWLQRALCEDQQAASLLPPKLPGGPILLGAHARAECAYQDWKWAVDDLWEDERHRFQTAARQCHLDKETARQLQEANCRQRLLDKRAAYECQKAVRCQRLLDKETARCQRLLNEESACCLMVERAALAQQMAAAQTIFLWLCRRRLHVRLARQTLRQQQCKAALARLRYEQECCLHAAMADERQQQAAATQEKALADEADEQRCQEEAAHAAALVDTGLAKERCCHEMATIAAMVAEKAIAQLAAMLAEMASTAEQRHHEAPRRRKRWPMTPTNNVKRPCRRKRWWTRPKSDAGPPRGTKRWPTRLTSDIATSRRNVLRLWRQKRLPRASTTRTRTMLHGNLRHMLHPSLLALTPSWPKSEPWMMVSATGMHSVTRSLPRRTTKPQL